MAMTAATTIVPNLLDDKNYEDWSVYMKNYLLGQHLWSIVEHGISSSTTYPHLVQAKNGAALHAIHITCRPHIFAKIRSIPSAKDAWDELARMMQKESTDDESVAVAGEESAILTTTSTTVVSIADFRELSWGMWKGEWDVVKRFLEKYPINTVFGRGYGTVLHLAIQAGQDMVAEKLVEMMSTTDLEIKDYLGNTALNLAAKKDSINIAKCLARKHPELLTITSNVYIPALNASALGHGEMTRYLYSVTPPHLFLPQNGGDGIELLWFSIRNRTFDICLDLLGYCPNLAVSPVQGQPRPLLQLSLESSAYYSGCRLSLWQRWIYHLVKVKLPNNTDHYQNQDDDDDTKNTGIPVLDWLLRSTSIIPKFLGIKEIYDLKLSHLYALQVLRCMCNYVSTLNHKQQRDCHVYTAASEAARRGTYEFPIELWKVSPPLVAVADSKGRDFFMNAIQYRQHKVFCIFYDISYTRKVETVNHIDNDWNNVLHVAGELAPASQLSRVSGEALQMQRELQWFKEVENITPTPLKEAKNLYGLTPREVFTENHKELLKGAEKWMKDTEKSFIIVGTLIVTIMFAVAFTVPGGNDQNTGFPIFLGEKSFKIFLISDAVSFFAASTSILMFLGILTSRYAEDDFLVSLPTKLIIGLSMLFISTATMMVSFSATLVIMLRGQWWAIIPILLMASIPVTLFVWLQFPLLVRIFVSTYGSGIFREKVKVMPE